MEGIEIFIVLSVRNVSIKRTYVVLLMRYM